MMKTSQSIDTTPRVALFPGSFDPFTLGHESIVRRALPLFDRVVIAIGVNPDKQAMLSVENRRRWIESVFANEPRVSVATYTGLTTEAAREVGATVLLRGVRMVQDFEYEMIMAEVNRELSGLETVLLYTLPSLSHISSSIVRELYSHGIDVSAYLPADGDKRWLHEQP